MIVTFRSINDRKIDCRKFPNNSPSFKISSPSKRHPKASLEVSIDSTTTIIVDSDVKWIRISCTDACGSIFTEQHFFANWGKFPDDVSIELVLQQLNEIEEELKQYQK